MLMVVCAFGSGGDRGGGKEFKLRKQLSNAEANAVHLTWGGGSGGGSGGRECAVEGERARSSLTAPARVGERPRTAQSRLLTSHAPA